jgi:hypothetical protein
MLFYIWCDLAPQIAEYSTNLGVCGSKTLLGGEAKREEFSRAEPRRLFASLTPLTIDAIAA